MKKFFSIILTLVILTSLFNSVVFGRTYGGDSGWFFGDDGIITSCYIDKVLTEENGKYKVVVPYSVAGIKIVGLGDEWLGLEYEQMKNIEVYIPSTITSMTDMSLHNGPITYMSEHPIYCVEKGSYADKFISDINNKNSSMGDAYRIKYVDSVEKLEVEDQLIESDIEFRKERMALSNKEISVIDTDLKDAFKNKIAEHPKSKYFIIDIDNDNIPELYIVNIDEKGNLIDADYTHTVKIKDVVSEEPVAYERYGYKFYKSEDAEPKLASDLISYTKGKDRHNYTEGFYVSNCNGAERLIEKSIGSEGKSYDLDVVYKYYNSSLIYVNNYNENETHYQYINKKDFEKFLAGEQLEYGVWYDDRYYDNKDEAYEKRIIDYVNLIEKNPVKLYSTTDLTAINNWDFSNIKVSKSNTAPQNNDDSIIKNDIIVILNDKNLEFTQSPVIENGTTLVPMRAIFEAMEASVEWNNDTKTVTSAKDGITIKLTLDSNSAIVNDKEISLAVPAKLINGNTMVPLRFVSESLGTEIKWDGKSRTITINE